VDGRVFRGVVAVTLDDFLANYLGSLIAAWGIGFLSGVVVRFVRQLLDKV